MRYAPTVAWRELRSFFVSPVAYGVLSLFAVLAGLYFVLGVAAFNHWVTQLRQVQATSYLEHVNLSDHLIANYFQAMSVVLLFVVPGITMGLFAAEKSNGTEELLLTSPLSIWDVVLGKFFAGAIFVTLLVAMVGALPGLLFVYGEPEFGKTASGLLGLLLLGWTYVSIGAFASSVTRSQVVSFLIAFVLLLFLLILPSISNLGVAGGAGVSAVLKWIATAEHYQVMLKGLVDTADIGYFAVMTGCFLLLTKASVESVRWR